MYPSWCSRVLPMSLLFSSPLCSTQNPSAHHGICSKFQFFSSLFFSSDTDILSVFTLMLLLRKEREYFMNSSQSVREEYLSLKASFISILSASGIGLGLFKLLHHIGSFLGISIFLVITPYTYSRNNNHFFVIVLRCYAFCHFKKLFSHAPVLYVPFLADGSCCTIDVKLPYNS